MEVTAEELRQPAKERADLLFCLVGRFLTDKQINFIAKKNTLALLWEPRKGITITEVDAGRYLFQFYHEVDISALINNGPWTFIQHTLVLRRLAETEQAERVPLS